MAALRILPVRGYRMRIGHCGTLHDASLSALLASCPFSLSPGAWFHAPKFRAMFAPRRITVIRSGGKVDGDNYALPLRAGSPAPQRAA
jgi:hypothetical protein